MICSSAFVSFFMCLKFSRKDAETQRSFFNHAPVCQICLAMSVSCVYIFFDKHTTNFLVI